MVPSWGEATVVSREQGGQVSAPNEAGRQRRGPEAVPQCPRHRDSAVESKQRRESATLTRRRWRGPGPPCCPPGSATPGAAPVSEFHLLRVSRSDKPLRAFTLPLSSPVGRSLAAHAQPRCFSETGLVRPWVRSPETVQAEGGRRGPHGSAGVSPRPGTPQQQTVVLTQASERRPAGAGGGRIGVDLGQAHSPRAAGVTTAGPWLPCDLLVERSRGRSSGTAQDGAAGSSLPWEQSWRSALTGRLCWGAVVTPAWL